MDIVRIKEFEKIESDIRECSSDLFDQTLNQIEKIAFIAKKYSDFACFAELREDEELAGIIAFYCNDFKQKDAFLSMIVIKKQYQKRGIGKLLLGYMEDECKKIGMKSIKLEVAKANLNAQKFYLRMGYRLDHEEKESIFMCKEIG